MEFAQLQVHIDGKPALMELAAVDAALVKTGATATAAGVKGSGAFSKLAKTLFSVKGMLVSIGSLAVFGKIISTTAKFEQSMADVLAVTRATHVEMGMLEVTARKLGSTTKFSATQAADAMAFLGMAGFNANQIVAAMPGTLSLAAAGTLELAEAADIASNVLSGFRLEAEQMPRVADVLAEVAASANTSVGQMGSALRNVAPLSAALGISLEETAASIGVLSNAGIQGELAGTAMRIVFSSLIDPTDKAREALERMGLTAQEVSPQFNSATEIVQKLADAGLDATDALAIFSRRGAPAILALTGASGDVSELADNLERSAGAAERMAAVKMDTLVGDWLKLKSATDEVFLSMGREGGFGDMVRGIVQAMTRMVEWINQKWFLISHASLEVVGVLLTMWTDLQSGLQRIFTAISFAWQVMLIGLKTSASVIVEAIRGLFLGMIRFILSSLNKVIESAQGVARSLSFVPGSETVMGGLESASRALESKRDALPSANDTFTKIGAEIRRGLVEVNGAQDGAFQENAAITKENTDAINRLGEIIADGQQRIMDSNIPFGELGAKGKGGSGIPDVGTLDELTLTGDTATGTAADMFNRFGQIGMGLDALLERRDELRDMLSSDAFLSEATVEDVQARAEELATVSDELFRRFEDNAVGFSDAVKIGFTDATFAMGTFSQRSADMGREVAGVLDNGLSRGLSDMVLDFDNAAASFSNMAQSMIADLVRIMIQTLVVQSIMRSFGALSFGGGAPAGITGDFGAGFGGGVGNIAHGGAVVGSTVGTAGEVQGDEAMVRARKHEGIFTEDQMEALGMMAGGGRGGAGEVNIINVTDPSEIDAHILANPDVILNAISKRRRQMQTILANG